MPWPTLVRKWFVVSVGKPFSERPWRSLYPHLHLLCICLYAHHYHYFSCSLFILKFTSCGQEHNFICHHIPIPHSSSTYCSSKIHLDIYLDTQAGEKYWHEHHFICCDCGVRIRGDSKVRKIIFIKVSKNQNFISPSGVAERGSTVLRLRLQEEVRPEMRRLQRFHTWGRNDNKIWTSISIQEYIRVRLSLLYCFQALLQCYRSLLQCYRSASGLLGRLGILNTFPASWVSISHLHICTLAHLYTCTCCKINFHTRFLCKNCQKSLTAGTGFHEHKGRSIEAVFINFSIEPVLYQFFIGQVFINFPSN